jgi:antitoxin CptB
MSPIPASLRWACRRGMLELDLLLGRFLEGAWPTLPPAEQAVFVALLSATDQDLFVWLTGRETAPEPAFQLMVEKIRRYASENPLTH